jgi:acyl transferase domain-containing protein/acyl carrier protein
MTNHDEGAIAIVAMECRIPGASSVDQLWELLLRGECTLQDLTDEQLLGAGVPPAVSARADYVRRAGVLEDVDKFDETYFDMSSREADVLDVQQRLMLEAAVTLLNRGNVDPSRASHRIGVFAGSAFSTYFFGVLQREDLMDSLGEMLVRHGNDKDFLATRISYKLNLTGPSLNVQTSCSTGLVAMHTAVQSLLLGECDLAMAGAVCIKLPQHAGYKYQADGVLSPDGQCRPFDADAKGTIFTNGLGLVLLKRLADAVADGDDIVAVIAGSAVNNDGARKVGFTAPSVGGQVEALSSALDVAGVRPEQVQYIEAHGTGTLLGDPIEVEAIKQAYGTDGPRCGIGSLKGNFGHFNIAAGIIGLIKAALVVKHGVVPQTLNLRQVNPQLGLDGTRFFVTDSQVTLDTAATRYAAVSAFGMGGTNSHVVLRSHHQQQPLPRPEPAEGACLLAFSAKNLPALERMAAQYAQHLRSTPGVCLQDVAYTAHVARPVMSARAALVARSAAEAAEKLSTGAFHKGNALKSPALAFVFGGQGTQHIRMGQDLARQCPAFAERLAQALDVLGQASGKDLAGSLWQADQAEALTATDVAQPVIFAVEYALASTLLGHGVRPTYLMGHSLGELVAATVSGVFDLPTAAAVVARRAQLMAACPPGAMLSVESLGHFEPMIRAGHLAVAAHNAPRQHVLAGEFAHIDAAADLAKRQGLVHQRLRTSHAFHSPMMREAAQAFQAFMSQVAYGQATIPMVSNVTGQLLGEYEVRNPLYWSEHLLRTVRFSAGVDRLLQLGVRHFVEVGHGFAMSNLVRSNLRAEHAGESVLVQAMGAAEEEYASYLDTIALGATLAPGLVLDPHLRAGRKVDLPVYPFARNSQWVSPVLGFQLPNRLAPHQGQPAVALPPASVPACEAEASPARLQPADAAALAPQLAPGGEANPVEGIVHGIYREFLGGDQLDHALTFFDLGGNSLVAIQLINRLRETFQVDVPLRGFYQRSSIESVSQHIAQLLLDVADHV